MHQLCVTEEKKMDYRCVGKFMASVSWSVRRKEAPAGSTKHLFWFLANYTADSLEWQLGHWKWSGPDHFHKVFFTYLENMILLPSYFFVV